MRKPVFSSQEAAVVVRLVAADQRVTLSANLPVSDATLAEISTCTVRQKKKKKRSPEAMVRGFANKE